MIAHLSHRHLHDLRQHPLTERKPMDFERTLGAITIFVLAPLMLIFMVAMAVHAYA